MCRLPVLMYHHFAQESTYPTVVSFGRFREQLAALRDAGYHTVTIPQLIAYVDGGAPLPDKPVLLTMDDGYTSNIAAAAPVLEEMGFCATVFVIGINEGESLYAHTGAPLSPERFSYEEAAPWVEKGVLDLQSHTFDMHQLAAYGHSSRDGMLRLEGEEDGAYVRALRAQSSQKAEFPDLSPQALKDAYPGRCQSLTQILSTTDARLNGLLDSNVNGGTSK